VPGDFGDLGLFGGGTTAPMMAKYPGVKQLFDGSNEIIRYTKQTGINPIIHVIALTQPVVERHPDLPGKLTRAFKEARDAAAPYMDADEIAGNAKERDVLGEDPYAYAMDENGRRTLAALNRYQIEQGLLKSMLPMDELFIT
jgi:4,5-dihydroxyphthalate decarboxylase